VIEPRCESKLCVKDCDTVLEDAHNDGDLGNNPPYVEASALNLDSSDFIVGISSLLKGVLILSNLLFRAFRLLLGPLGEELKDYDCNMSVHKHSKGLRDFVFSVEFSSIVVIAEQGRNEKG
jgi:hypothetical protein